jgi:signal transduction histidine kinase/DNA-binding response OmpR family regulator
VVTIGVLFLTFVALALGQWFTAAWVYDRGFDEAEQRDALSQARHAQAIVAVPLEFLQRATVDNATWDEVYDFIRGTNPQLPKSLETMSESFRLQRMSAFGLVDRDGRLRYAREFDQRAGRFVPVHAQIEAAMGHGGLIARHYLLRADTSGYSRIGSKIYRWCAAPVLHSDASGPPAGWWVALSELDADFLESVSRAVGSQVTLSLGDARAQSPSAAHMPIEAGELRFFDRSPSWLSAAFPLGAIDDAGVLDLTVTVPRDVRATAARASRYLLWMTLIFGTLLSALAVQFVERRLLRPVEKASRALAKIGRSGDLSRRLEPSRHADEIGQLVESTNEMLAELEQKRDAEAARDAAIRASQLKSEFLARMSHEIRTPMNGVLGMTELLLSTPLDHRQRHFAQAVHQSADSLLAIINDILDFSKIEAGRIELEDIDFDLQELVEQVFEMFTEQAFRKKLALTIDADCDVPGGLRGDPLRLRQILTNLVSNAIKFTEKGEVRIRARARRREDGGYDLVVAVSDTGIGIRPENVAGLFQSFQQGDDSTTRRFGGTGLGLAISRELAHLMGGEVMVQSEFGAGSTFTLRVALRRASAPLPELQAKDALRGCRLLVVDDAPVNSEILRHYGLEWGMETVAAGSGPEAMRALREAQLQGRPFDAALVDMKMPNMDGAELLRRIRSEPGYRTMPAIILTSTDFAGDLDEIRRSGCDTHLFKPVRKASLLAALLNAVSAQRRAAALPGDSGVPSLAGVRVLLAEDNEINREIAEASLQSLGCEVVSVDEGAKAVQAFGAQRFDAILMDCQMPVLDGFEATQRIRSLEAARAGARRVPIIALTANAIEGDRERCHEAGMDDYVGKPFRLAELSAALTRATGRDRAAPRRAAPPQAAAPARAPVFTPEPLESLRALKSDGWAELVERVLGIYLERAPALVEELRAAARERDATRLNRAAHSLKSASANVGAAGLAEMAAQLEAEARTGAPDWDSQRVEVLAGEFEQAREALERFRGNLADG